MGRETDPARILSWIASKMAELSCIDMECMIALKIETREDVDMLIEEFMSLFNEVYEQSNRQISEENIDEIFDAFKEALEEATEELELKQYIGVRIEEAKGWFI